MYVEFTLSSRKEGPKTDVLVEKLIKFADELEATLFEVKYKPLSHVV